ncbi:hypothetical protein [Phyllobacterium myrsinacearum]|uniref:Uncharacterized protein n=1 Tax=Phyllobacterium myrsinacearum TaxID=28101 RepID=A0A839ES50_9HYPH|nr:hypothetical protein [Phyllobacterium myrsinacearum]MBA8881759.1 hypothetical protein [Phyllobacterium myrsinacearum]
MGDISDDMRLHAESVRHDEACLEAVRSLRKELKVLLRIDHAENNAIFRDNRANLLKSRDDLDILEAIANETGRVDANIRIIVRRARRKKTASAETVRSERYRNSNPNYGRF